MNYLRSIAYFISLFIFSNIQANVQSFFNQIKNDPNQLNAFFKKMPKGGELHYHLAGGAYPEIMLKLASEGNYCLDTKTFKIIKYSPTCAGISSKELFNHPDIYTKTLKSWSMKDFIPGKESGHDHFFNSFEKFMPIVNDHQPELVASVLRTAAQHNEQYMEIMLLPDDAHSLSFGHLIQDTSSFKQKRDLLLADKNFQNNINHTVEEANQILKKVHHNLKCETNPEQKSCQIKVKFLYYSLREQPFNNLFAQTLNAFEAVNQSLKTNGALVGVNLVQPEDGIISLSDYHKQMQLYQYFHKIYPKVNIALHAGELTQEFGSPDDLDLHIHDALFVGQAQRIGHGVEIASETNSAQTLKFMASQHKAVEINLVSNQKILNVSRTNSPLDFYLKHQVPVVLSTDDEGILRTNITQQYVTAVLGSNLDYQKIKQINRNALTYSFLPGKSIWEDANQAHFIKSCQNLQSSLCKKFIKENEKAQLQWNLEQKLNEFESKFQ